MDHDNAQLSTFSEDHVVRAYPFFFFRQEENPLDIALDGFRLLSCDCFLIQRLVDASYPTSIFCLFHPPICHPVAYHETVSTSRSRIIVTPRAIPDGFSQSH